jgi:hypothetical protein
MAYEDMEPWKYWSISSWLENFLPRKFSREKSLAISRDVLDIVRPGENCSEPPPEVQIIAEWIFSNGARGNSEKTP